MSYYCDHCGEPFGGDNELRMHEQVHLQAVYECFKCNNCYRKYADMLSHAEKGCFGMDAEDLNKSAAMIFQWKKFLDPNYRSEILDMSTEYGRDWNHEGQPWKCPNCGKWFKKLSSLFAHVWSVYGGDEEDEGVFGKLQRWLWKRHA